MVEKIVGKVSHFFPKICVAIVEVKGALKVGDKVKFVKDSESFEQVVSSMQIDYAPVKEAKKGQSIGMKVDQPVKTGAEVYKI